MIVKNHRAEQIEQLLKEIKLAAIRYNKKSDQLKIQYAVGYEYGGDSLPQMLEKADKKMYLNKTAVKADTNDL